jgi:hypothetical protein
MVWWSKKEFRRNLEKKMKKKKQKKYTCRKIAEFYLWMIIFSLLFCMKPLFVPNFKRVEKANLLLNLYSPFQQLNKFIAGHKRCVTTIEKRKTATLH